MVLSAPEREQISLLRRHAHAAGSLAQAVADAASPLALAQSLQVAVQSCGVVAEALRALAATTETVELDTNQVRTLCFGAGVCCTHKPACAPVCPAAQHKRSCFIGAWGLLDCFPSAPHPLSLAHHSLPQIQALSVQRGALSAPDPDTPRLLPSVHLAWAPLVGALKDWRVPVVEAALQLMAEAACLSGSFLRKRFAQEAAPALRRLLSEGPTRRAIIAPGQDDTATPAAVQRAQLAALRCLHRIAACETPLAIAGVSSSASEALLSAAGPLLAAVGDAMGARQAATVREQATQVGWSAEGG